MKNFTYLKLSAIVLILWGFSTTIQAQVNDTLVVEISPTMVVKISADNLKDLKKTDAAPQLIREFQKEWITIKSQVKRQSSYDITYRQDELIEVDSMNQKQLFSVKKDVPSGWLNKNRCTLLPLKDEQTQETENNLYVLIYFEQLEELEDSSMLKSITQALDQVSKPSRFTKNWYFKSDGEQLQLIKEEQTVTRHMDMIYLNAGIGAALIKNTGMVNIGFSAGINIGSRGRGLHRIFISDEMDYVFDNNSSFTINNFLGIGYAYNFSRNPEKEAWYGLEAGFLTNKNSNFFADDTYRLGFIVSPVEKVNIKPFLYFEDSFQKVYPGIGVTIDF